MTYLSICLFDAIYTPLTTDWHTRFMNHEQSKKLELKLGKVVEGKMAKWQRTVPNCTFQDVVVCRRESGLVPYGLCIFEVYTCLLRIYVTMV